MNGFDICFYLIIVFLFRITISLAEHSFKIIIAFIDKLFIIILALFILDIICVVLIKTDVCIDTNGVFVCHYKQLDLILNSHTISRTIDVTEYIINAMIPFVNLMTDGWTIDYVNSVITKLGVKMYRMFV
jgi:hypothetical protein